MFQNALSAIMLQCEIDVLYLRFRFMDATCMIFVVFMQFVKGGRDVRMEADSTDSGATTKSLSHMHNLNRQQ